MMPVTFLLYPGGGYLAKRISRDRAHASVFVKKRACADACCVSVRS